MKIHVKHIPSETKVVGRVIPMKIDYPDDWEEHPNLNNFVETLLFTAHKQKVWYKKPMSDQDIILFTRYVFRELEGRKINPRTIQSLLDKFRKEEF